jgi:squalene-hopene/tetraprenyl-beta-curcumene cyclase
MTLPAETTGLQATIAALRERLLAARRPQGYWQGRLSSSALSTATAVFALAVVDREKHSSLTDRGLQWLCRNQNADGGWGDTVQSPSNLSTTMLCYSALAVSQGPPVCREAVARTELWLHGKVGSLEPQALAKAVERQYGKDRTFSGPILTMCTLAGRLGTGGHAWRLVRPLPFELAVLPQRLYKWLRLPVVSYALPALIAIGQARYEHLKPRNPLIGALRRLSRARSLDVLARLQPENGGFLEAAPLTSFVIMSLAASGHGDHEVVSKGVEFLAASIRDDGSWPIDTNLATWVTTLSVNALSSCDEALPPSDRQILMDWLASCQCTRIHLYTQAEPGGWAWSNLPGAVPDADDTAGALIALHTLSSCVGCHALGGSVKAEGLGDGLTVDASSHPQAALEAATPSISHDAVCDAVSSGIRWLLGLQNGDGGVPTFCRGWTKLPVDKSSPDITAHALGAMGTWLDALPSALRHRTEKAMGQALRYLQDAQLQDGSWVPLWFGNQHTPKQENPVYGTSRALTHRSRIPGPYASRVGPMRDKAVRWLLSVQNADGGWGGARSVVSTIEETALAVDALATTMLQSTICDPRSTIEAVCRGTDWLIANTNRGRSTPASNIGLYFAQLWYFEELYPIIFSLSALGKVRRLRNHSIVS